MTQSIIYEPQPILEYHPATTPPQKMAPIPEQVMKTKTKNRTHTTKLQPKTNKYQVATPSPLLSRTPVSSSLWLCFNGSAVT
ncbi:hypothetical protein J1614_001656 [Plenodomus biglobosus]|nr:hypothetical protein J1614_001656 [Plenodomus biglobosus]